MSWVHKKLRQLDNLKRGMPEMLESHGKRTGEYCLLRMSSKSKNIGQVEFVASLLKKAHFYFIGSTYSIDHLIAF